MIIVTNSFIIIVTYRYFITHTYDELVETLERTISDYLMFNAMEIWEKSTTATSHDDGVILASCGENRERRRTNSHTLPVRPFKSTKKYDLILKTWHCYKIFTSLKNKNENRFFNLSLQNTKRL